jgi:hypothetical protein
VPAQSDIPQPDRSGACTWPYCDSNQTCRLQGQQLHVSAHSPVSASNSIVPQISQGNSCCQACHLAVQHQKFVAIQGMPYTPKPKRQLPAAVLLRRWHQPTVPCSSSNHATPRQAVHSCKTPTHSTCTTGLTAPRVLLALLFFAQSAPSCCGTSCTQHALALVAVRGAGTPTTQHTVMAHCQAMLSMWHKQQVCVCPGYSLLTSERIQTLQL